MTEIEEKFFEVFGIGKPVIKKWYYDGYYEDFSWQSEEEDCTELLKYFDNSIDKLNDKIQELKKDKEINNYDISTDSVSTEFGRISGAYTDYPQITSDILLELICICSHYEPLNSYKVTLEELKNNCLEKLIELSDIDWIKDEVQSLFAEGCRV